MKKAWHSYSFLFLLFAIPFVTTGLFAQVKKTKTAPQIQQLLKEKQSRTAAQRKIESQLLQAIRENTGKKMADGVDLEPIKVPYDTNGNVPVDISGQVSDTLLNNINALGGRVISSFPQYKTIRASVPLQKVETIAGYPTITFIQFAVQAANNAPPQSMPVRKFPIQ